MKKIIISAGPMPAKLDSVKIVTNRFKGRLTVHAAEQLSLHESLHIEIVKWRGTNVSFRYPESADRITITEVDDLFDYREYIRLASADAYVLAAAVSNLAPANPWPGKFPSHNYRVGEEFDVRFKIAPRIIDEVKVAHPRSTLIGYKLFDGPENELLAAGWETLCNSRANVIFCNHPATAAREKIALMPDGTQERMSFDQHIGFIERVINLQWYTTITLEQDFAHPWQADMDSLLHQIGVEKAPYVFGTVAVRDEEGFITTTRGKRGPSRYCRVFAVDHASRVIKASNRATLNAPFIEKLLALHPTCNWVIHAHRQISAVNTYPYSFSGTMEETQLAETLSPAERIFNVENHGYYAVFESLDDVRRWLDG